MTLSRMRGVGGWRCAPTAILWIGAWMLLAVPLTAAEPADTKDENAGPAQVEMFAAIEAGQIEVQLIPKDENQGRIFIKNKTKEPLSVQLPEAFAGRPVLAQRGGGFGGNQGGGGGFNQGGGGGNQSVGGGLGGGGGGGGFGGGGGGFFNVPPEKIGQIKYHSVCLEHGKADPNPRVPYEIVPLAEFSDDAALYELMRGFGAGRYPPRAVQAAAWHIASGMSWQELAAKQIRRLGGVRYPYFSQQELRTANAALMESSQLAELRKNESTLAAQEADEKADSLSRN